MRVCRLIHSFSLVWDLSFFLFESVVVLLPSLRPRVLMTRARPPQKTTTMESSSSSLRRLSFSFDSLFLSLARIAWGDLKSRLVVRFLKKERDESSAKNTTTGIDERVSLSKKNDTHALLRFRTTTTTVSSLLLLSTDIRKIQNKSGEPETVENARWRIMIRCDEACVFPLEKGKRSEREIKICALFFLHSSSI